MSKIVNFRDVINEIRLRRWIKSILVFLPLFWVTHVYTSHVIQLFIGFLALSLTSSIIYIFNDIKDVDLDKKHPLKKERPIASGRMTQKTGVAIAFLLAIGVAFLLFWLNSSAFTLIIVAMLVLNTLYTNWVKNIPYIELVILGVLYALRAAAGFVILGLGLPIYALLAIIFATMFMKALQRYIELKKYGTKARNVLRHYSEGIIKKVLVVVLMLGVIFYHLAVSFITGPLLFADLSIILVLAYMNDFVYSTEKIDQMSDNLIELVLSNRLLLGLIGLAAVSLLLARYWL